MARAVRTRMRLTGLREMARTLRKLPDELRAPIVRQALMEAAEPMRDTARELAPDQEPYGEGLPALIIISDRVVESQGEPAERRDEVRVYVGTDGEKPDVAAHGILAEFGTGPRVHESGKSVGQMPASPFLRPAFDTTKGLVFQRFARLLKPLIEGAVKRLRAN